MYLFWKDLRLTFGIIGKIFGFNPSIVYDGCVKIVEIKRNTPAVAEDIQTIRSCYIPIAADA